MMRILASDVMPATAQAMWSSILYIFSGDFPVSSSFDDMRFSAANTIPSAVSTPTASPDWLIASIAYSTCRAGSGRWVAVASMAAGGRVGGPPGTAAPPARRWSCASHTAAPARPACVREGSLKRGCEPRQTALAINGCADHAAAPRLAPSTACVRRCGVARARRLRALGPGRAPARRTQQAAAGYTIKHEARAPWASCSQSRMN